MTADSGEALRRLIVDFEKRAAQADNDEWGRERESVYIECADAIRTLLAEGDAQEPPQPQHALTIYFGRFLTEQEWRAVVDAVRAYVPFEHLLEANAITRSKARDSRPAPPLDWQPIAMRLRAALVKLVGADGRAELEQMEMVMRALDAPGEDKAASIDAIHALIKTLPVASPAATEE